MQPPFENSLVLTGSTASGKSALGIELAHALNAEIISMDSMTLYCHLDIGTAKPSDADRAMIPHHLIDVLQPHETGSVAWWLAQAAECVRDIESRGKQALFVGGTPLYLKALLHGLFDGPPADAELRARLEQEAAEQGGEALRQQLAQVDPVTAARLHPHDVRRIVRALEVWQLTGRPISEWQQQWIIPPPTSDFPRCLRLEIPREDVYARINQRVLMMLADGWMEEVERLMRIEPSAVSAVWQSIGYAELRAVLQGELAWVDAVERIQTRTRQFAKRQFTWFRNLPDAVPCGRELTFVHWASKMNRSIDHSQTHETLS